MKRVCTLYVFVDRNFKRKLIRLISTRRICSREATFCFVAITYYVSKSDADKAKSRFARTDSPSVGNVLQVGIEPASLGLHHRISPRSARQKVDSSNRCHAMIHQNADAMVLASALLRGIPPWTSAILNIIRGVNASQTRTG